MRNFYFHLVILLNLNNSYIKSRHKLEFSQWNAYMNKIHEKFYRIFWSDKARYALNPARELKYVADRWVTTIFSRNYFKIKDFSLKLLMIMIQKYIFNILPKWKANERSSQLEWAHNLAISSAQLRPISLAAQLKNQEFWAAITEARA